VAFSTAITFGTQSSAEIRSQSVADVFVNKLFGSEPPYDPTPNGFMDPRMVRPHSLFFSLDNYRLRNKQKDIFFVPGCQSQKQKVFVVRETQQ
jgi:hypothetical protein